ncbi:HD domain-containing phosphohydrolase [Dongia sedimenti]|uniref:PAS domain-containing protein n=1 Tax=Dongia sedimenti TaxID=3064282 RepID=A0ABU0YUT8_9PROT|nr:PAS domain-containing protein [Rhodospirillaceae bacterium R-7]
MPSDTTPAPEPRFSIVEETAKPRLDWKIWFPLAILVLIAVIGMILVSLFVENERDQAKTEWRTRMGIVADSRAADVNRWFDDQYADLQGIAGNQAVQVYLQQIAELSADPTQVDQIEGLKEYLRNIITVTADRAGFTLKTQANVDVNETQPALAGLLIIDEKGTVLAASPNAPAYDGDLKAFASAVAPGQRAVSDLFLNDKNVPSLRFVVPILAPRSEGSGTEQVGRVVGVKQVADELYSRLLQPGETTQSGRSVLVQLKDNKLIYLSPIREAQIQPLTSPVGIDATDRDVVFGAQNPGSFATDKKDHQGTPVLVASRALSAVPWVLVYTVSYEEALGPAEARFRTLTAVLFLTVGLIAVIIAAVWYYGSSRRASQAAYQFNQMAQKYQEQSNLLQLVTDSQPTSIFILDKDDKYRFANRQAAKDAGIAAGEMIGKPIANVLGPAAAKRVIRLNHQAMEENRTVTEYGPVEIGGKQKMIESEHIPLKGTAGGVSGVLSVEDDITDFVNERERRVRNLNQLVKTLVDVVDKRDPFAAQHSARVAHVARAVAKEMNLSDVEIETAEIAGNLLNLGKILIPESVLAKTEGLTDEERGMIRNSIMTSAQLIRGIEFDGPVVETLQQAQANYDGTGNPPLKGDEIVVTARVIAVANAFIGMISDRAFRQALSIDQAIEALMKGVGKAFDRRVVAALINYLDNHGGRDALAGAVKS